MDETPFVKLVGMSTFGVNILPYLKRRDAIVLNKVNSVLSDGIRRNTWLHYADVSRIISTHELTHTERVPHFPVIHGLTLTPDESLLLACDMFNGCVLVFNARDGSYIRKLHAPHVYDVAVVPQTGQVLVVNKKDSIVHVLAGLDNDTVIKNLGSGKGDGPLHLLQPTGIDVLDGEDGPVAVIANTKNNRLTLFRVDDGTLVRNIGELGTGVGQFKQPFAVKVVPVSITGTEPWLAVAEGMNQRVQVLTSTGVSIYTLAPPYQLSYCLYGLCISNNELFVSDNSRHRVVSWRLSDGGGFREVCKETDTLKYPCPDGIAISKDGERLWMADSTINNRLCLFHLS